MILFWMVTMVNNKFDVITYSFLMYVIKRRDAEGLIYLSNALIDCVSNIGFSKLITEFFIANYEALDKDDADFFNTSVNNYLEKNNNTLKEPDKQIEDLDMQKITKAVILFEKNGLVMGTDYSLHKGKIRMKKESQEKIKKLLGKG